MLARLALVTTCLAASVTLAAEPMTLTGSAGADQQPLGTLRERAHLQYSLTELKLPNVTVGTAAVQTSWSLVERWAIAAGAFGAFGDFDRATTDGGATLGLDYTPRHGLTLSATTSVGVQRSVAVTVGLSWTPDLG